MTNSAGAFIAAFVILTNAYTFLPGLSSGGNSWSAHICAGFLFLFCLWLLTLICDRFYDESFGKILPDILGNAFGRIFALVLAGISVLTLAVSLTVFSRFVRITALPRTPQLIIPLLLVATAAFSLKSSLRAASGVARLLVWFFCAVFLVFVLGGISELSVLRLSSGEFSVKALAEGTGEVYLNRFATAFALMSVYTRMPKEGRRKWFLSSAAASAAAISAIALITVSTLGIGGAAKDYYPVYSVMSLHGIGGFIRHTEILACIAMVFSLFFKSVVCLLFADEMLACTFNSEKPANAYLPIGLISVASTYVIYKDSSSLQVLLRWKPGAVVFLGVYVLLPAALLLILKLRFGKEKRQL